MIEGGQMKIIIINTKMSFKGLRYMLTKDLPRGAQRLEMWDGDRRMPTQSSTNAQPTLQHLQLYPPNAGDGAMIPGMWMTLTTPTMTQLMTALTGQSNFRLVVF